MMDANLSKLAANVLMEEFDRAVLNEKAATHLVLQYIHEVSQRSLHLQFGYESIYKLLTLRHKYSSNQAYDRIDAARVLKVNPQVINKVQDGSLNLTQLIKVGQCMKHEEKAGRDFTAEQSDLIFEQIENKTIFETEKVLAVEMDFTPKKHQKITPQSNDTVTALMIFTSEEYELIRKVQSLISHSVPNNDLAKAFVHLAENYVRKLEGKKPEDKKANESKVECKTHSKVVKFAENSATTTQGFPDSRVTNLKAGKRSYISIKTRRQLMRTAKSTCEHYDAETGKRCGSQFCLQVDHIIPFEYGGSDHIQNLRILCGFHNRARNGMANAH
ncbi:MAG: HNH endonuclease [Bdellovibrionaceae bacterium]|nr:HNH endonuclease [Pseudobdellovibrionaceae bacterium]